MPELLTASLLVELLKKLRLAFPTHSGLKTPEAIVATAELYSESLSGLTGDAVRASVRIAIDTGKFFPKVAELRETAWEWTRRHRVDLEPAYQDPMYCPRCNSNAQWRSRWRPAFDKDGYTILSEDRQYVQLERYERLLCACASVCLYSPEPDFESAWMAASKIKWSFGLHRNPRPSVRWRPPRQAVATIIGDISDGITEGVMTHA